MSVNVMTVDEINEVSGADFTLDSAGYGGAIGSTYGLIVGGAEGAAYFGPGLALGFAFGVGFSLGDLLVEHWLQCRNP